MKISYLAFTLFVVFMMACCSSPYKYLGKTYPQTGIPELFFRSADVPKDYEEMGKLEVQLPSSKKLEKIQDKVIEIAGDHGADAVLIDNFDMKTGGFTTVSSNTGKREKEGQNYNVGAQTTEVKKDILVKATLVKFKENLNRSN